jgi:hypothetical protein
MDVPRTIIFSNIIKLLKAMSLTPHACSKLKPLDYNAITIEFMNCFPTKFNGEILFEFFPIHHPLGHFGHLQGMNRMAMLGASCKLITLKICFNCILK